MNRNNIRQLTEIPNIGKKIATKLSDIGITNPQQLIDKDPYQLYDELCLVNQQKLDPCLLDVLISATRFMTGAPAKKWWEYTAERKKTLAKPLACKSSLKGASGN